MQRSSRQVHRVRRRLGGDRFIAAVCPSLSTSDNERQNPTTGATFRDILAEPRGRSVDSRERQHGCFIFRRSRMDVSTQNNSL